MDDRMKNYVLIVCIVLILAYFFKGFVNRKYHQVKSIFGGLVPNLNFIYL